MGGARVEAGPHMKHLAALSIASIFAAAALIVLYIALPSDEAPAKDLPNVALVQSMPGVATVQSLLQQLEQRLTIQSLELAFDKDCTGVEYKSPMPHTTYFKQIVKDAD